MAEAPVAFGDLGMQFVSYGAASSVARSLILPYASASIMMKPLGVAAGGSLTNLCCASLGFPCTTTLHQAA